MRLSQKLLVGIMAILGFIVVIATPDASSQLRAAAQLFVGITLMVSAAICGTHWSKGASDERR